MHLNADPSETFDPALRFGLGMERLDDIFTLEKGFVRQQGWHVKRGTNSKVGTDIFQVRRPLHAAVRHIIFQPHIIDVYAFFLSVDTVVIVKPRFDRFSSITHIRDLLLRINGSSVSH
jgi:hypothetical protein